MNAMKENASTKIQPAALAAVGKKIESLMREKKAYLKPDLTLDELSSTIGSNKTYVYRYLKQEKHASFSDYINQLRIEKKALPLLKENPGNSALTIQDIAFLSGFQSISTFRRAFLKHTGMTASSFINRLKSGHQEQQAGAF